MHRVGRCFAQRAMGALGNAGSSIQSRMPKCRQGAHHTLFGSTLDDRAAEACFHSGLRLPRNCSGAMYGSLPQSPVDMWMVFSQGKRYTVDAP